MISFSKIKAYIFITRPINVIITFLVVIVGALICVDGDYSIHKILLAAVAAGLTAGAGNIINDIHDKEADKINHPERPLAKGIISTRNTWIEYFILTLLAIAASSLINQTALAIVILTSVLLYLYSARLKKIPLIGNITVAYLTGLAFIFGGIAVNNIRGALIPAVFAFIINFIRELIKDMDDIEGDTKVGLQSFPKRFGMKATILLITSLTVTLIAFTFYPFIKNLYNIEFFVLAMLVVNPILVYFLKLLYEKNASKNLNKLSNMLKLNMLFGLLAIFLGK
ncbi:MAG: geranylgeranylglycerol-phosphate geranylgeranyltransferase [Ignavibacteriaceae bacterium]|jgi:geranylgeranylglycerol-phosphate geranylgeranyltransferase